MIGIFKIVGNTSEKVFYMTVGSSLDGHCILATEGGSILKTLETNRLILRDWNVNDFESFFRLQCNPKLTIPEGRFPIKSIEDCKPIFNYLLIAKNNYALVLKDSNEIIGYVGLNEDALERENTRNLGFIVDDSFWNKGLLSEALQAIIKIANEFTEYLSFVHSKENIKSAHIAEKFGFRYYTTIKGVNRETKDTPIEEIYLLLKVN